MYARVCRSQRVRRKPKERRTAPLAVHRRSQGAKVAGSFAQNDKIVHIPFGFSEGAPAVMKKPLSSLAQCPALIPFIVATAFSQQQQQTTATTLTGTTSSLAASSAA